jgi:thiamine-monophosphate kinase
MNEFELIKRFIAPFGAPSSPAGPGDDCAVLPPTRGSVVTTDAVVEGVHFTRRTFSLEDVGHKALAVNLSDLAAMAATPTWFVCALGLPADVETADVQALARGMAALAKVHGARLVGGNVTRSLQLSLTITAAGEARHPLLRSGAKPGDGVYVSGQLGDAAAGLELLREHATPSGDEARLIAAQRRPAPHLAWAHAAARDVSAAIDVSDGLLQDLGHLCLASGVGADLDSSALPISEALLSVSGSRARAADFALRGGEDYVVLATVPEARRTAFERRMGRAGLAAFRLGTTSRKAGVRLDGQPVGKRTGFVHFD